MPSTQLHTASTISLSKLRYKGLSAGTATSRVPFQTTSQLARRYPHGITGVANSALGPLDLTKVTSALGLWAFMVPAGRGQLESMEDLIS